MEPINIASAQFENHSGDKAYNLSVIDELSAKAASHGAQVIAFHECSITGYSFARNLSHEQMLELAEYVPDGNSYCVFELHGWKCGILICYDNNIIENIRATKLLGADIIFMPHVTMCTPSTRPGAGFVDPDLWHNRKNDPDTLRAEFDGPKGREWLMKWLPARAYDNAVYAVFSNPIGMDDDQLKNGCSMIIDPFGNILTECRELDNDLVIATLTPEKLIQAGGHRYIKARRPDLYKDIIGQPHTSEQKVIWLHK